MAEHWLFSYGTLRDEALQRTLFNRLLSGVPDVLPGYRQCMVEITDPEVIRMSGARWHPMVEPGDPSDAMPGMLYRLDDAELAVADSYEVDYVRRTVTLGSGRVAFVYGDPADG